MAHVVAFANIKGGVGKTTLCVNTAHCLAQRHGKRVLVIDADPQMNATMAALGAETASQGESHLAHSIKGILHPAHNAENRVSKPLAPESVTPLQTRHGFDLLAGSIDLSFHEGFIYTLRPEAQKHISVLRKWIAGRKHSYDLILLDTPPTVGAFLICSLAVSDMIIAPTKPDLLSLAGVALLGRLLAVLAQNKDFAVKARPLGAVFTMIKSANESHKGRQKLQSLRDSKAPDGFSAEKHRALFNCFESELGHTLKIPQAQEQAEMILGLADAKDASERIGRITEEFLRRVEESGSGAAAKPLR